jgi:hypothetical protein
VTWPSFQKKKIEAKSEFLTDHAPYATYEKNNRVRDVAKFAIKKIPRVSSEVALFELLHFFGQGRSHLAWVVKQYTYIYIFKASKVSTQLTGMSHLALVVEQDSSVSVLLYQ